MPAMALGLKRRGFETVCMMERDKLMNPLDVLGVEIVASWAEAVLAYGCTCFEHC
jgi:hypothetical protein